jgi:hypothetical protein
MVRMPLQPRPVIGSCLINRSGSYTIRAHAACGAVEIALGRQG